MLNKLTLLVLILKCLNCVKSNSDVTVLRCNYEINESFGDFWCTVQNNHENGSFIFDLNNESQRVTKLQYLNSTFFDFPVINNMQSLQYLSVEELFILRLKQDDFIGAKSLIYLNAASNKIAVLPEEVFLEAANLETIDLGSNIIHYIDLDAFKGLHNLRSLSLNNNQIKDIQPVSFFSSLTNLEELNLRTNLLKTIPSGLFDNNKNLKAIILKNNYIKHVNSKVFSELPNLKILTLERNTCTIQKFKELSNGTETEKIILASDCTEKLQFEDPVSTKIFGILLAVLLGGCIILPIIVMCFFGVQGCYLASS